MKKTQFPPLGDSRKAYEKPSMNFFQMDMKHVLLADSDERKLDIIDEDEEEWPEDPDTGKPFSPW